MMKPVAFLLERERRCRCKFEFRWSMIEETRNTDRNRLVSSIIDFLLLFPFNEIQSSDESYWIN